MLVRFIILSLSILVASCASTSQPESSEEAHLYPKRIYIGEAITDFAFTDEEKSLAKKAAKNKKLDVLFEVFLKPDDSVESIRLINKTKLADNQTVGNLRKKLKSHGFFSSEEIDELKGLRSAFYYGIKLKSSNQYESQASYQ